MILLRKLQHNKFDLAEALTSNCFSEACGTTYAHVNFTATPKNNHPMKRLFFAELMLIPEIWSSCLQKGKETQLSEPMRVLRVVTIDDAPCFGTLYESFAMCFGVANVLPCKLNIYVL
jgi:hypothetical protein